MLITLPADAYGGPAPASVLDLTSLLAFARACRPDAVCLKPPIGPDDQPNGAGLLAIRERLEAEGLRVFCQPVTIPATAPVTVPSWRMATLFESRALAAALGEAGLSQLVIRWYAAPDAGDMSLLAFLDRLLEEANRNGMRIALQLPSMARLESVLLQMGNGALGTALPLAELDGASGPVLDSDPRLRLQCAFAPDDLEKVDAGALLRPLAWLEAIGYEGPLYLGEQASAPAYAEAITKVRGLIENGA